MQTKKNKEIQPTIIELLLVTAVIEPADKETVNITFGSQAAEERLINLCKENPENWNLFKKVVNDTIDKIEAAANNK